MAEKATSSCCCILLLSVLFLVSCSDSARYDPYDIIAIQLRRRDLKKPCDEIYVVREGETLHSISEKCGDPFIVEENPHIHDPDDVFPGLVIHITPFRSRS